jgi:signal transduction histidine kinase
MRTGLASVPAKTREWQSFHGSPVPLHNDPHEIGHDFVRALHHRLCQPLTALNCTLEIMQMGRETDTKLTGQLQTALSQTNRIVEMMGTFRQLFEAEVPQVSGHATLLEPVVTEVVEDLRPLAELQKVSLVVWRSNSDAFVDMSGKALRQTIWNVVQNCIELTPEGGAVTVEIHGAEISLLDGSDPTVLEMDNLFDPFSTCTNKPRVTHVSNLPLALAQRLISAAGGRVHTYKSLETQGRCFELHLTRSAGPTGSAA